MTFKIIYRCTYYPQEAAEVRARTRDEWDAYKFCKGVKHAAVNGFFYTKEPRIKFNEWNIAGARQVFGNWMIEQIKANFGTGEKLVPVPSKDSWNTENFRTLAMVRASMPNAGPEWTSPMVRFTAERQRASEGGPRGYAANYPYLGVTPEAGVSQVVLVDDIVTSGGTLLAARRRLIEAGINVLGAVVVGRTASDQEDPWKSGVIEVSDDAVHLP